MYKSTDGGDTWTGPLGLSVFNGRAIGSIAVRPGDPNTIYAATTRGVLGVSSVTGGTVSLIPGAAAWGLYKSTDGGETWTFLHNGAASAAALRHGRRSDRRRLAVLAARRAPGSARSVQPRHDLCGLV